MTDTSSSRKKRKENGVKLTDLIGDCWSVVSEYFSYEGTVFNVIYSSPVKFFNIFQIRTLNFFRFVTFTFRYPDNHKISENFKNCQSINFVHRLDVYPAWDMSHGLYQTNQSYVTRSEDVMLAIYQRFPKLKSLKFRCASIIDKRYPRKNVCSVNPHFIIRSNVFLSSTIQELHLNGNIVKDIESIFHTLSSLSTLRSLTLSDLFFDQKIHMNRDSIVNINGLSSLQNLKFLKLKNINIDDFRIELKSESLEVFVYQTRIPKVTKEQRRSNDSFDFVLDFPNLNRLYFHHVSYLDNFPTMMFRKLEKLETLHFITNEYSKQIQPFWNLVTIPTVSCYDSLFDRAENSEFGKSIKELNISNSARFSGALFSNICNLQTLDISNNYVIDPQHIRHSVSEKLLYLDISFCTQKGINDLFISSFTRLEYLMMAGCNHESITKSSFEKFTTLKGLNVIDCCQKDINMDLMKSLFQKNKKMKCLQVHNKYFFKSLEQVEMVSTSSSSIPQIRRRKLHFGRSLIHSLDSKEVMGLVREDRYVWLLSELGREEEERGYFECKKCEKVCKSFFCNGCHRGYCSFCVELFTCSICFFQENKEVTDGLKNHQFHEEEDDEKEKGEKVCKKCIEICSICERNHCVSRCAYQSISVCLKCERPFCKETCGVGLFGSQENYDYEFSSGIRSSEDDDEFGDGVFCNNCKSE